jgi:hypothetical protein
MNTDTHEKLIRAVQNYIKWHDNFEYGVWQSEEAGVKARNFLSEIKDLATIRREEILKKKKARKAARKGIMGRPRKIHNE